MRLRHPDGTTVHVAYCTNVHPAEDLDGILAQVRTYGAGVRAALGAPRAGLGLWLAAPTAHRLAREPESVDRLRSALDGHGLEVVTLNAFPYAGFHAPVVKHDVYHPDWTSTERLDYTLDCARVLARLLPDDAARGSVSTLPLAWRAPWDAERWGTARENLLRLGDGLARLRAETGRTVRVALEPEPGCVIERTADAAALLPEVATDEVGLCLDTCHLAVAFEEPEPALARLAAAGVPVVKAQVSAALHAATPDAAATRAALASFAEDRFLHQVREAEPEPVEPPPGRDDLPAALAGADPLPGDAPWRVHFHIPLHLAPEEPLHGTQEHLRRTLRALTGGAAPVTDHLEVETYTWSVLPERHRPTGADGLARGLAGELAWVRERLLDLGLKPEDTT